MERIYGSITELAETTNNTFKAFEMKGYDMNMMMIISTIIASVGIVANLVVDIVFLNQKKMRCKIPNMFIINQVSSFLLLTSTIVNICFNLLMSIF